MDIDQRVAVAAQGFYTEWAQGTGDETPWEELDEETRGLYRDCMGAGFLVSGVLQIDAERQYAEGQLAAFTTPRPRAANSGAQPTPPAPPVTPPGQSPDRRRPA